MEEEVVPLGAESSPSTSGWPPGKLTVAQMGYSAVPDTLGTISSAKKR